MSFLWESHGMECDSTHLYFPWDSSHVIATSEMECKCQNDTELSYLAWVAEPFSKWGGTSARWKEIIANSVVWIGNFDVTSIENDIITYTAYEGLNYTILAKTTPLWKGIAEPPEIPIGCCRIDPGLQRHSGSSYDLFWLKKKRSRLASLTFLFAFIQAGFIVAVWSYVL